MSQNPPDDDPTTAWANRPAKAELLSTTELISA